MKILTINCIKALGLAAAMFGSQGMRADIIDVVDNITGTVNWTGNNEYVLNGFIYVLNGGVLNIEAGTVIKALPGQDADTSCLIVARGGKIYAQGTQTQPIIFTADADDVTDPEDLPLFQRGLWGGVVLMGRARINTATDLTGNAANPKYEVFEALPDRQINGEYVNRFGGDNDEDSSGVMRYVSIRHAGMVFAPNKELNGLSLCGVGRGTVLEYIETYATADDGFEFFGGAVNTRYLVSAFNDDDGFDVDMGWRGKNQFWLCIQEPGKKDNGGEWNGEPSGVAAGATPRAEFEIYNATWIGAGKTVSGNWGLTIREYSAPRLYNSILTEFGSGGARITDDYTAALLNSGVLDIRDTLWWDIGGTLAGDRTAILFSDSTRSNLVENPLLRSISRSNDGKLDPRLQFGSPALSSSRQAPDDGFYNPVTYKGAFDTSNLWIDKWTFLSQAGFVPEAGVVIMPPNLKMSLDGTHVVLSWASQSQVSYQVEAADKMSSPVAWAPVGNPVIGAGEKTTITNSPAGLEKYYRVRAQ